MGSFTERPLRLRTKGDIAGYHCWAEFYAQKTGWIPVDISEAWKAKEKQNYFFGSVDANRVQFSTGRDITLSPKQDGPALNYFVYPYVEIDGKPYERLDQQFGFEEVKRFEVDRIADSRSGFSKPILSVIFFGEVFDGLSAGGRVPYDHAAGLDGA